jgi:hypothetical protein
VEQEGNLKGDNHYRNNERFKIGTIACSFVNEITMMARSWIGQKMQEGNGLRKGGDNGHDVSEKT